MKRILNIGLWLLTTHILGACDENVALLYENDPALYFKSTTLQKDSVSHTFFMVPSVQMRDTVLLQIATMGIPADVDRPFILKQTNAGRSNAAIAGKHYVGFDTDEMQQLLVIPAGAVSVELPLILLRDKSLDQMEVILDLRFEENEYFREGYDALRTLKVKTTAQAVKPALWDRRWRYYFGASWGSVKMKFIIDYLGFTDFDKSFESNYYAYLKAKAQQKLLEYNTAHPDDPLKEADGTLVSFVK